MGGTISRMKREGSSIYVAAFSACQQSNEGFNLKKEFYAAMKQLGLDKTECGILEFPVRNFPAYRQHILDNIITFKERMSPSVVFVPCTQDNHQDHQVVSNEAIRAFKNNSTLYGFVHHRNCLSVPQDHYVRLDTEDVDKKLAAIDCYESQKQLRNTYLTDGAIESIMKTNGLACGADYAEVFQVIRVIK